MRLKLFVRVEAVAVTEEGYEHATLFSERVKGAAELALIGRLLAAQENLERHTEATGVGA